MATQFLDHDGGKIAYEVHGDGGPLVLCAPGMGDLRAEYRFLLGQLAAAGYSAAAMDVRGHGESSPHWRDYSVAGIGSDMAALIRHLGGPAVIVGASMAAGAAVWAAAEAPQEVRGLVLAGPFVSGGGDLTGKLLASLLFTRPWGPAMWVRYFTSLFPTRKPADLAEYTRALQANLAEPGRNEALQAMLRASKASSAARLSRVQAPTLVLMGSKDPDFKTPEEEARRLAGQLRGAVRMVAGAGHYPHAEMPEIAGPAILAFLEELNKAAPHAG